MTAPSAYHASARQPEPATGLMVETRGLVREYRSGGTVIRAVDDVNLRIGHGELVAVRGRSGSGKTTLLSLIGALDRPTSGEVLVEGLSVSSMRERELVGVRRRRIGFIFQAFGLLPILSAAENVEVPLRLVNADPSTREARIAELLELVGLGDRMFHRPHELSGGEQQRVAIARALANEPALLLADEPTGQLDSQTGHGIMALLRQLVRYQGVTAIVATHDPAMLDVADRVVELRDGKVVSDGPPGGATEPLVPPAAQEAASSPTKQEAG
ncbi:MAG TPA: ABC transporter ATP-binding protein [Candidatus Limnocylindria bacterium]|nr:ABC transporter ATP-binding protein [Candidatus Limnocylindria bacterium]